MRCRHVGLWRARVDSVDLQARRMPRYTGPAGPGQPGRQPMKSFQPQLHLTVCDDSGARSEITVPYDRRCCFGIASVSNVFGA